MLSSISPLPWTHFQLVLSFHFQWTFFFNPLSLSLSQRLSLCCFSLGFFSRVSIHRRCRNSSGYPPAPGEESSGLDPVVSGRLSSFFFSSPSSLPWPSSPPGVLGTMVSVCESWFLSFFLPFCCQCMIAGLCFYGWMIEIWNGENLRSRWNLVYFEFGIICSFWIRLLFVLVRIWYSWRSMRVYYFFSFLNLPFRFGDLRSYIVTWTHGILNCLNRKLIELILICSENYQISFLPHLQI